MKTLHQLTRRTTLIWYGRSHPCQDDYHSGYEVERPLTGNNHDECVMRAVDRRFPGMGLSVYRCACTTCNRRRPAHSHYFVYPDSMGNDPELQRCIDCVDGRCPQVPLPGTTP